MILFLFIFGLFLGSFIGVLSDRLPKGKQVIKGRSACDYCKHKLAIIDLIPILSFILLKAKCRYCNKSLSYWYPIVEIITGFILVVFWLWIGSQCNLTFSCVANFILLSTIFLSLFALLLADIKYYILPDSLIISAFIFSIIIKALPLFSFSKLQLVNYNIFASLLTGFGLALFFFLIILATKGKGMGFGDVKLSFFIGFFLGFPLGIISIYLAFLTGAFVAVILIVGGKKRFGQVIAFGPFLIIGTIIAFFFQTKIYLILGSLF